jgi:hypothetical protein
MKTDSKKKKVKVCDLATSDPIALAWRYLDSDINLTDDQRTDLAHRLLVIAGEPADRDSRSCFGVYFYDHEAKALVADLGIRVRGDTYNGGFFHGMPCGRDRSFDTSKEPKLYAVTTA